jgi:hypothetical protein
VAPRHGGGRAPTYDTAARDRILREVARTPTPEADGTAPGRCRSSAGYSGRHPTACPGSRRSPSGGCSGRPGTHSNGPAPGARPGAPSASGRPAG